MTRVDQAQAGIVFDSSCTSVTTMSNFDQDKYVGDWYEIKRDWTIPFEFGASCVRAKYRARSDGDFDVYNEVYYWPFSFTNFFGSLYFVGRGRC